MQISGAWSVLFAGAAALASIAPFSVNLGFGGLLLVLGDFSSRFGAWYSTRRLRAMGLPEKD